MSRGQWPGPANAASPATREREESHYGGLRDSSPTCSSRVACPGLSPPLSTPRRHFREVAREQVSVHPTLPLRCPGLRQNLMRRFAGWVRRPGSF